MSGPPPPIDPRGPRFNQAVLAAALLVGFVLDVEAVAPVFAAVLFLGAALGPRYGPFLRLYAEVVKPRLPPPRELEDPRPPRFAAAVGVLFLLAATISFAAGASGVGWALTLVVAALAALAAATGMCLGCEIYLLGAHRRLGPRRAGAHALPASLVEGTERTWVVFTTPYCASCGPVIERLRAFDPIAKVVNVDATDQRELAAAFSVRTTPTVLLADRSGEVQQRLVGAAAVHDLVDTSQPASS